MGGQRQAGNGRRQISGCRGSSRSADGQLQTLDAAQKTQERTSCGRKTSVDARVVVLALVRRCKYLGRYVMRENKAALTATPRYCLMEGYGGPFSLRRMGKLATGNWDGRMGPCSLSLPPSLSLSFSPVSSRCTGAGTVGGRDWAHWGRRRKRTVECFSRLQASRSRWLIALACLRAGCFFF